MINFKDLMKILTEQPMIIDQKRLNEGYVEYNLDKYMKFSKETKLFQQTKLKDGTSLLYYGISLLESIYVWVDKDFNIISATNMKQETSFEYKNKLVLSPTISKRYSDDFNHTLKNLYTLSQKSNLDMKKRNVLQRLFKLIHRKRKAVIMCDEIQTPGSKKVWIEWVKNPQKYGIKWWTAYDIKEKKDIEISANEVEQLWGETLEYKDKRIIVEFK